MDAHAAAAVQQEIMYLSMLHTMKYEGTTPVEGFLKKFELARKQLMAANLQTTPDIILLCLSAALHDPINPPAKGQDGMAFVGPSTWLDEQEPMEVDTYDRLNAKLEIKFTPTIKTSTQIINKIQTIKYSPDKTIEELITEIDKIVGRTRLEKYVYQTLLMERAPLSIAKKLMDSDPEWRDLESSDLKKKLIVYDAAHRNPDVGCTHYASSTPHLGSNTSTPSFASIPGLCSGNSTQLSRSRGPTRQRPQRLRYTDAYQSTDPTRRHHETPTRDHERQHRRDHRSEPRESQLQRSREIETQRKRDPEKETQRNRDPEKETQRNRDSEK
ncbi:hypothetical protein BDD12DRAFT_901509 [Trichophaea hybrida]|nr:hypothetical protein BDD12DRAFT_901509 [Trichophaea hybrida]